MGVCSSQPLGLEDRCVGALIGSLCSDAAAMSTHWIYEADKMKEITDANPSPLFLEESKCPFYKKPCGSFSSHGDQVYVLLKSIVDSSGFDQEHYAKSLYAHFGPDTIYDAEKKLGHEPTKEDYPLDGGYRNKSIKEFIKNYEGKAEKTGAQEDAQADGMAKVAPLVALHAGNTGKMLEEVEKAVRVTQEDQMAVNCSLTAAVIMEQCILGKTFSQAVEEAMRSCDEAVKVQLQKAFDNKTKDHTEFAKENGQSDSVPTNLGNSVHCLLHTDEVSFEQTLLRTVVAGGCNCSRSLLVGGCLGAALGPAGIPTNFLSKTTQGSEVVNLVKSLMKLRQPPKPQPIKQENEPQKQEQPKQETEPQKQDEVTKLETEPQKQEEVPEKETEPQSQEEIPKQETEPQKPERVPKQETETQKQEEKPTQETEPQKQEEKPTQETEPTQQEQQLTQQEALKQEEAKSEA